jgi:hypothetical protein
MVDRVIQFIFKGLTCYSKKDLAAIHEPIAITQLAYKFFVGVFEQEMKKCQIEDALIKQATQKLNTFKVIAIDFEPKK